MVHDGLPPTGIDPLQWGLMHEPPPPVRRRVAAPVAADPVAPAYEVYEPGASALEPVSVPGPAAVAQPADQSGFSTVLRIVFGIVVAVMFVTVARFIWLESGSVFGGGSEIVYVDPVVVEGPDAVSDPWEWGWGAEECAADPGAVGC